MKVEFGVEDWSDGEARPVHESALSDSPSRLAWRQTIEGYLRIVVGVGEDLRIRDDLTALMYHLGGIAPAKCLGEGALEHRWLLMSQPREVVVTVEGDQVRVTSDGRHVEAPAAALWPALVAAAQRYRTLTDPLRGPDEWLDRALERGRAEIDRWGWELPLAPEADPVPAAPSPPRIGWSAADLYADRVDDAAAFYRDVLGIDISVRPSIGSLGQPQWVGSVVGAPLDRLTDALLDGGGVELSTEPTLWMDRWGALVGGSTDAAGPRVVRHELRTLDPAGAAAFYAGWFVWRAEPNAHGWRLLSADGAEAGTVRLAEAGEIARWKLYLAVKDVDAAVARALALGAHVVDWDDDSAWLTNRDEAEFGLASELW